VARLRRSDVSGPGIVRRRCGRGFTYAWTSGERVTDAAVLERIATLAIPPAWVDVWICPWPNGHLQAIGTDDAGRRQYRYHDEWRRQRDRAKFVRIEEFARVLPQLRKGVAADISGRGMSQRRILATGVRLLDIGCFRVGGEEYAEEHETFGVATLRIQHVTVRKNELIFEYPAKGSILRTATLQDPDVHRVIQSIRRRRSADDDLLAWKQGQEWVSAKAPDINAYIKEHAGEDFSAKDFRTWSGTVRAAVELARLEDSALNKRERNRAIVAAVKHVAEHLGNTPAVARSSYIDPRIIDSFEAGDTIAARVSPRHIRGSAPERAPSVQKAVLALLDRSNDAAA
jgi:DNA topoisomerase I